MVFPPKIKQYSDNSNFEKSLFHLLFKTLEENQGKNYLKC